MAEGRRGDVAGTSKAAAKAGNVEAGKENASRQAMIKQLKRSFIPESKFVLKLGGLTDTNLGSFNLEAFKRRIYGQGGNPPSVISHNIVRSGLYAAASFPSTVRCLELIMECANYYNSDHRTIVSPEGKLLANFIADAIGEAFGIQATEKMLYKSKERSDNMYATSFDKCAKRINTTWMRKPKPPGAKLPKQIISEELKQEYCDLIMLLSRVNGSPQAYAFELWMFFYISVVLEGKECGLGTDDQ